MNETEYSNAHDDSKAGAPSALQVPVSRRQLFALAGGAAFLSACGASSKAKAKVTSTTVSPLQTIASTAAPTTTAATTAAPTTVVATTAAPDTTAVATQAPDTATATATPAVATVPGPPVQPLTGLALTDPALLDKVALVVKVSNDPGARPQTGLNNADIVVECWGAGPTRFATIWHSQDLDFVGPIRSCREQDVNLVGEFNRAVFACSGGNAGNLNLLRNSDLLLITEGMGPGWELDPKKSRPHKTHANTALLRANASPDRTGPAQQYHYRGVGEAATAGDPVTGFDLAIQQVHASWRYDAPSDQYLRSQDGGPHRLADGKQVTSDNVIVLWLDYNPSHTDGRSPDGQTTGSGDAFVFTGGRMITGSWKRDDRLNPFSIVDASGNAVLLKPGRTFIELPNSGKGAFPGTTDSLTPVN